MHVTRMNKSKFRSLRHTCPWPRYSILDSEPYISDQPLPSNPPPLMRGVVLTESPALPGHRPLARLAFLNG